VLYYARRIRVLFFNIGDFNIKSDVLFNRINKAAAFRSLRALSITNNSQATSHWQHHQHPFPISAPNLETLEFYGESLPEISTPTLLSTISSQSQNLKSLIFETTSTKTIVDVLPRFRELQFLRISGMDCHNPTDFLTNCALSMASLRTLMVDFLSDDFGQPASGGVSRNLGLITFGLLSHLHLAGHFRRIENVMNILLVPKLVSLSLHFQCGDDSITNIGPFIEGFLTLNGQHLKDGLRTLSLKTDFTEFSIEGYLDSFKAFTKLNSLCVLTSRSQISMSGLANFLHENKLWSDLTAIDLDSAYVASSQINDALSIAALPLLADKFPKLLQIQITIDNPAIKTDTTNATRPPHGLETLSLASPLPDDWTCSTSSAVDVASFLHQLFPKLKKVESDEESEWINEVQEMLKEKKAYNALTLHKPGD